MRKTIWAALALIFITGCTGAGNVEVGLDDEGLLLGVYGDLKMRVLKAELYNGEDYSVVFEGIKSVTVSIQSSDFASITDGYEPIPPNSYDRIRLTVDSLQFVEQTSSITIVDTVLQFTANAFTDIVIEDGDELQLVVNIVSQGWFDADSMKIKSGHQPFEGAALKVYYPL